MKVAGGKSPALASCRHTVRDSGKSKNSRRNTGFDGYSGSGIRQKLATGCGIGNETVFGEKFGMPDCRENGTGIRDPGPLTGRENED